MTNTAAAELRNSKPPSCNWRRGLSGRRSVGSFGIYRDREREEAVCLPTCANIGGVFYSYGDLQGLFSIELPDEFHLRTHSRSWTGQSVEISGTGWRQDLELRVTLPGPLIRCGDAVQQLRWQPGNDAREILLAGRTPQSASFHADCGGARMLGVRGDYCDTLMVSSHPIQRILTTSNRHWRIEFAARSSNLFVIPLLKGIPVEPCFEFEREWLLLAGHPPVDCEEEFREEADRVVVRQHFEGSHLAPVPPMFVLAASSTSGFLTLHPTRTLLQGVFGPWSVADGEAFEASIASEWMDERLLFAQPVGDRLPEFPEEMVYAGDWTWDPASAMDQLLTLRTWAPLVGAVHGAARTELADRLAVPDAASFRSAVLPIREPVLNTDWARPKDLWAERGDCAYDPDWCSGLVLSGLARAVECAEERISRAAWDLASQTKKERTLLAEYFSLYHDWSLCSALSDPRGNLWLPDCAHNGMEGMLGEARLRMRENDPDGAAFLRYLSAKSACSQLGATAWARWLQQWLPGVTAAPPGVFTFVNETTDPRIYGVNVAALPRQVIPCVPSSRNPYLLAGHFPEYSALLRDHYPVEELEVLAAIWEKEFPGRYTDWVTFYLGDDWRERFHAQRDQEARVQASVFYHLAPEVCLRLWVLRQPPEAIARLYRHELNLAEFLLLQSAACLGKISDSL